MTAPRSSSPPPVFGFTGSSGSGKTTLVEQVIPLLVARGLSLALIKHAHHGFDMDQPGKDSFRHRAAGCAQVLVTSDRRWALLRELGPSPEPTLAEHVARLAPCDLVLVEGYKQEPIPKIEVYRAANGKPPLYPDHPGILAVASDLPPSGLADRGLPWLDLNQPAAVAAFVLDYLDRHDPRNHHAEI